MDACECSAAPHLLSRGLFPCAPNWPSLAVDVNMLQFATSLFYRTPPNISAWSDTVESSLASRGYKLATKVLSIHIPVYVDLNFMQGSLRRRFSSALRWYVMLADKASHMIDEKLEITRGYLLSVTANRQHTTICKYSCNYI